MNLGLIESTLNGLPEGVRKVMLNFVRQTFKSLAFGAPSSTVTSATNFGGHLVAVTTSGTTNQEVAIRHGLPRVPRLFIPALDPSDEDATLPEVTVTKAADATYLYVSSPETSKRFVLYVE